MVDTPHNKEKPVLTPPQGELPRKSTNPLAIILVAACLLILLVLSGIVIWLLPSKTPQTVEQNTPVQTTTIDNKDTGKTLTNQGAIKAEQLLETWLQSLAEAEAENIQAWGGEEYAEIHNDVARGDLAFRDGNFDSAQLIYKGAVNDLKSLLDSKEDKLQEAIHLGREALKQKESQKALLTFQQALLIDPENEAALHGARRADNLDRVLALYNEGLRMEEENNLQQAQQLLREAGRIDSDFAPAAEALEGVDKKLQDLSFKAAMSRAIAALDRDQITTANEALDEAARLRPEDPSMASARLRSKEMDKVRQLKSLQVKAGRLAHAEDWEGVAATYHQAIQIDAMVSFATIGLPEAEKRIQLDKSLKSIIARPDRLQDDGPLREARQILKNAKQVETPGEILQSQLRTLSALVKNASTIVAVILRSNNATEVEIYHVGRFRPFTEKSLTLKPGTYTVVGRRPGFKDVRLSIKIAPEMKMPIFVIRCEELI